MKNTLALVLILFTVACGKQSPTPAPAEPLYIIHPVSEADCTAIQNNKDVFDTVQLPVSEEVITFQGGYVYHEQWGGAVLVNDGPLDLTYCTVTVADGMLAQ